ncbi:NAD-dependent epimerase [Synergistales bacterium]|nr:NAD-dependent epimerase [Synergistales bacterium]
MNGKRWLITGAAGFIGSHILEALMEAGQDVVGLDNLSSGFTRNIEAAVQKRTGNARFEFIEGDIRDPAVCERACEGVDIVLHHAAFVSVPGSLADPALTHAVNVDGFVNVLQAAKNAGARRFIYASSSAVYGDCAKLPSREEDSVRAKFLSPYALSKAINEMYAAAWSGIYASHIQCVGLRYFNVFGARQDPNGPYAAVIPRWIDALKNGAPVTIYGDGTSSRDFCYVKNVVSANMLAANASGDVSGQVFNIACGEKTTLNELFSTLKNRLGRQTSGCVHEPFRAGDIAHSFASIERARSCLNYKPIFSLESGIQDME